MPQASKNAENTEVGMTEIDAAGIKTHGKHGNTRDRDRCRRHQNTLKTRKYKKPRSMQQAPKLEKDPEQN
jgi:hypothetical protein